MDVTLSLNPEVEKSLLLRSREHGVSLEAYLYVLVARDIAVAAPAKSGEEAARAFIRWADSFPETPPLSDEAISRANLYPDRL